MLANPDTLMTIASSLTKAGSTAAGLGVLAFIVLVHEAGHFLAARLQGIRVKDFSIGFGPKLIGWKPKNSETQFTLRALPLGGFVAFPEAVEVDEETGEERKLDDPNLLQNRPLLDRAIVISAGVIANLFFSYFAVFTSVNMIGIPTFSYKPGVVVTQIVDPSGPGAKAGILRNDVILSVNELSIGGASNSASVAASKIRSTQGKMIHFKIERGNNIVDVDVTPRTSSTGESLVGVQLSTNAIVQRKLPDSIPTAFSMTNFEFERLAKQTAGGFLQLFTSADGGKNVSGPVAVVSIGADLAQNDVTALFYFSAVISLNLALINSLPLPALDGGQMAFILLEAVRGSPVPAKYQDAINRSALIFFILLSGGLLLGDLEKLKFFQAAVPPR